MKRKKICMALGGAIALALSASADVISVNFTEGATSEWHTNQQMSAETVAGVYPRANWNNMIGPSGSEANLVDDLGAATTADLAWLSDGVWGDYNANADANAQIGDGQLARGYLDDGYGEGADMTVSDIPYTTYTVVLHMSTDTTGSTYGPAVINGVTNSTTGTKLQYFSGSNWMAYNTIVVSNLSNSTDLTIDLPPRDNTIRASIAGIQIVESSEGAPPPEPNVSPSWSVNPIVSFIAFGELFTGSLADKALDRNGDAITFTKGAGPSWLTIDSDGTMHGTPAAENSGTNTFTVVADDSISTPSEAELLIVVSEKDWTIAWNFAERWWSVALLGEGTVDGTDQWTDCVQLAAPGGTRPANSSDEWAVTNPINASMVNVAWSSANLWNAGNNDDSLEQRVYKWYLDDGGDGPMVTVSGLAAWLSAAGANGYTIDFYQGSDADANTFAELNIYDGTGTAGTLLESMPPMMAAGDGAYPVGSGVSGSRLKRSTTGTFSVDTITFHTDRDLGGGSRAGIAGFKITPVIDYVPGAPVTISIAGPVSEGTAMELSWDGESGKFYGVQTNSNLITGNWQSYTTAVEGVGATITITAPMADEQIFYRVISE